MARGKDKETGERALRKWLTRFDFMCRQFGFNDYDELRTALKNVAEGLDEVGRSNFSESLIRTDQFTHHAEVGLETVRTYDENIARHVDHINRKRDNKIQLKYYQWLAALLTERYLDLWFNDEMKLYQNIEKHLESFVIGKKEVVDSESIIDNFTSSKYDYTKCSFWMATGSGKTFLIHINYLQFLHYNKNAPLNRRLEYNRIILITPNADLTLQHLREMKSSDIPCTEFDTSSLSGYFSSGKGDVVNVMEITRFKKDKSDSGDRTVDIEAFEQNNLVFVDEAHKGSGGIVWKDNRDAIAKEGFTFEYSATFGQACGSTTADETLRNFAKTITFDYSYPRFYGDGYGKEYRILNLADDSYDIKDNLLLGNLLTFYEQKCVFQKYETDGTTAIYNIEKPLWIFVGHRVISSGKNSDVLTVILFLQKFLTDKAWAIQTIDEFILKGDSGLRDAKGHDPFEPKHPEQRLRYLRNTGMTAESIYINILKDVFNVESGESHGLTLVQLKGSGDGEIGLRVGDNEFFGDIYIGEPAKFIKTIDEFNKKHSKGGFPLPFTMPLSQGTQPNEITVAPSLDHSSIFKAIDEPSTKINILIGAKMFIEGWDCYRVSTMGLINVGKQEGTQIIQLFGRGIRLRGKDLSLKRSTNDFGDQPPDLPLIETLNIFGVGAKYINELKTFLGGDKASENKISKFIPIRLNKEYQNKGLLVPVCSESGFQRKNKLIFTPENFQLADVNRLPMIDDIQSRRYDGMDGKDRRRDDDLQTIDGAYLDYVNWDKIYFKLLDYKQQKEWYNLLFTRETLRKIIESGNYELRCPKIDVEPATFGDMPRLEETIAAILKKSLHTTYSKEKSGWLQKNSEFAEINEKSGNYTFNQFTVSVNESEVKILEDIKSIVENLDGFISGKSGQRYIRNVHFDTHLFQPLLALSENKLEKIVQISPEGLNSGEQKFVKHLQNYVINKENEEKFKDYEIYLLRNLPKRGIGFFKTAWYYPDFIIWMCNTAKKTQHIIFVDPKGLVRVNGFGDEKVQLCNRIKVLEQELCAKRGSNDITMDSFILSDTAKSSVFKLFNSPNISDYDNHHILFIDDGEKMVDKILWS